MQTDESGATKWFGLTVTLAERERQLAIARDEENMWLVTDHQGESRASYNGALDVDVVFSPFFNALPIRRLGLHERADSIALPMVYVNVPEMSVTAAVVSYTSQGRLDAIKSRRRSPTPPCVSTPTGSSRTIQDWQSGSDHSACAPRGGQLLAPVFGRDNDAETSERGKLS